jgi:hypothetical protein
MQAIQDRWRARLKFFKLVLNTPANADGDPAAEETSWCFDTVGRCIMACWTTRDALSLWFHNTYQRSRP